MSGKLLFLLVPWVALAMPAHAAGPSGLLNDTGLTECVLDGVLASCNAVSAGNTATLPRQDGRFGRDAATFTKVGAGAAGFDFTKICMDGFSGCSAPADTGSSPPASAWACTKDNVTNLIWSVQTFSVQSWSLAAALTNSRCGLSTGWRLPTRRELLSIAHNGVPVVPVGVTVAPAIDSAFFPDTVKDVYWSSDAYAPNTANAWAINFADGSTSNLVKTGSANVRLVRSGP